MACSITQISSYGFQDNSQLNNSSWSILPPPTISGHLPALTEPPLEKSASGLAHFLSYDPTHTCFMHWTSNRLLFMCLFPLLVYLLLERGIVVIFKPLTHSIMTLSLTKTSASVNFITLYDDLLSLFCHLRFTSSR